MDSSLVQTPTNKNSDFVDRAANTYLPSKDSNTKTTRLLKIAERCILLAEQGNSMALEILKSSE